MIDLFAAPENLPFAVALGLFFLIGMMQTVSLLTGASFFGWLDDLLPDLDFDADADFDLDVDADVDIEADVEPGSVHELSFVAEVFAWMNFGKVPFIISFLSFLFLFSCFGFNLQLLVFEAGAGLLPAIIMAPIVFVLSIFPLKWANGMLGRIVPKDETSAVSSKTFIGRVATITIGKATHDRAAEAKLKGPLGRTHYIMVKADRPNAEFKQGDHVLIVSGTGQQFNCIAVDNPNIDAVEDDA